MVSVLINTLHMCFYRWLETKHVLLLTVGLLHDLNQFEDIITFEPATNPIYLQ